MNRLIERPDHELNVNIWHQVLVDDQPSQLITNPIVLC